MTASFTEGKGKRCRYILDVDTGKKEPDWNRKSENEEKGWTYICTVSGGYFHIYMAEEDCDEIRKDREACGVVAGKIRNQALLSGMVQGLYLFFFFMIGFKHRKFLLLELMQSRWQTFAIACLFLAVMIWVDVRELAVGLKAFSKLKNGMEGKEKSRKKQVPEGIIQLAQIVSLIGICILILWPQKKNYENLSEVYPVPDFVDIQALEGETFQEDSMSMGEYPGINLANMIQKTPTVFSKNHYETTQHGGTAEYRANLYGEYWEIPRETISRRLYGQLVSRYTEYEWYSVSLFKMEKAKEGRWLMETRTEPGFLDLVTAVGTEGSRMEDTILIFARTERFIAYLTYTGGQDVDRLISELGRSLGIKNS